MKAEDIRQRFLDYAKKNNHVIIDRAKVVPENDQTTLFTGSGMQSLLKYLLGKEHPKGRRLADTQTCVRAQDIEEVGDNRHTTFFEMLGNWSLGDYFKKEQLGWFFHFLVDEVKLDPERLYVTCFQGDKDNDIPRDAEAAEIWRNLFESKGVKALTVDIGSESNGAEIGVKPNERIFFYDGSKNWWSRNGAPDTTPIGDPCGPDSEVFYEFSEIEHNPKFGAKCHPNCDCGRFLEIGNSVFMQYVRTKDGFAKLPKFNVDFGGGLERIAAAAIDSSDIFRTSLFTPIIKKIEHISKLKYDDHKQSMRVIADHLRAATFLAVDGVTPSNKRQGYVMRRLVRRAVRFAFDLGIEQNFLEEVIPTIAGIYRDYFPEVSKAEKEVIRILTKEEKAFRSTLRKGLKEFNKLSDDGLVGEEIFKLYDTYGFPVELSIEEATKRQINIADDWRERFDELMRRQKDLSKTAAKGKFKGGLGGQTWQHRRYHTATHLLQSALRKVFGDSIRQHGSNITSERLRFDFNLDHKMTDDEKAQVEDLVNNWIKKDLPVSFKSYPTKEALEMGAIGPFGGRYGETVKVYQIGEGDNIASLEICGGPHVDHTGQLAERGEYDGKAVDSTAAKFKIKKEESSSAGIRRIKAVLI